MSDEQGTVAPDVATPMPDAQETALPVETGTTESVAEQEQPEQQDEEKKPEDQQTRRLRGVEKRIHELVSNIHNERREKQQLVDIIKAFTGPKDQPQRSGAPSWDDFKAKGLPYEAFVEAKAVYASEQRWNELNQQRVQQDSRAQQETQARELGQRLAANHERSVTEFVKSHPDYAEVVDRDDIEIPNTAGALIQAEPDSAAIFYSIAKEPRLAQQLRQYDGNVVMQARVIGAIAARLQTTPQVSKAPPAGKTVGGKGGSSNDPPADPDAYMQWRKKNLR